MEVSSTFGTDDLLFVFDTKEQVVAETVTPMNAPPLPVVIHVSALRQPHFHIALIEFHRTIFDVRVIGNQSDLWNGRDQVRLQPHDLISVC